MPRRALEPRTVARVVAAFGFDALRGRSGTGTGAAPAHRLAELHLDGVDDDKRTVARKAARGIPIGAPPASTATPFDFAFAALFDWSRNGGQDSFEAALDLMAEVVIPLDPAEIIQAFASLMRVTVQTEFEDPEARFLTGFAVEALALDYIREQGFREATGGPPAAGPPDESLAWATWLIEQRRQESRQTTQGYEAVFTFGMLLMRRRPRPGYSVGRIVRAVQSLWIGGMHRAFLLPEEYPEYGTDAPLPPVSPATGLPEGSGPIELAMIDLVMGMTEESLFSFKHDSLESRLVVAGLHHYRTSASVVRRETLVAEIGVDETFVRECFPSDGAFASACFQWLAGEWAGFGPFSQLFRTSGIAGVEALLEWVASVHQEFPALLGAASFTRGDPAFDEIVVFVSSVFCLEPIGASGVAGPDEVRRARRSLEAAATGGDWRAAAGLPPRRRTDPVDRSGQV